MGSNIDILKQVADYCSLIHSTPGRIRVRVSPKIKDLQNEVNLHKLDEIIEKIEGIHSVKFNKMVGSITILYDNHKFPQEIWHDLLNGTNLENISQKINQIKKEYHANEFK